VNCDLEIKKMLREFEPRTDPTERPLPPDRKRYRGGSKRRKKNGHPHPEFDMRTETYKLFGVDVTQIPGLEENALPLFSEVGRDISNWSQRSTLYLLACTLSGQRHQRRETVVAGSTKSQKPGRPFIPLGSLFPSS
jgi:hypothetical protein